MDSPYVWEPCRGVTDGDRHARVCRGRSALVWCAWMWGEAGRSLRAVCVPLQGKKRAAGAAWPQRRGPQCLLPGCKIPHSQLQRS